MKIPEEIIKLVERFEENLQDYKSGRYNETQVRLEFIDPFFKALGWDVHNEKGYAEAYKDVIHEDAIKISGATKAPDYCFRIGGVRKFFLEAKKPSIDIKHDTHPAYQLRRYAWSAKLPLSILTDFEEFAVYDCRFRPVKTDKASTARILYLNFREYIDKWEEISSIFSREAVLKGSFDRYIESNKKKKGTAEVDSAFLKEIESWREMLAKNIALRNPSLSQRAINFSVQKTIDRIIFLRISEDRGLEPYGTLREVGNGNNVYKQLCELFLKADSRYISGLFHFKKEKGISTHPDELTLTIKIDDAPLKTIIKSLYYPDSPYEFSVLPSDILGQVYERFLGKVIRLTSSHRAVVEEKPEVRKAGGVYYTPTYIVDYIVKNTVGKLVEGKTPKQVEKLKILDPACGSGSFLIGAYQYLLNWHRDWYVKHGPQKYKKVLYQAPGGGWCLTTEEKKRILLNNIYGVDIDEQAVEVTKLALLLKVLEEEKQLQLLHERILPDLGNNIKCGNSLIGTDFYENQQMSLIDEKERYRINAFDWEKEFPEVFNRKNPGFDAVIGNPPYVKEYTCHQPFLDLKNTKLYKYYQGKMDLWYIFACQSLDLLKTGGLHSFIAPNNWITNSGASKLRRKILSETDFIFYIDFGDYMIFENASIQTMLYLVKKTTKSNKVKTLYKRFGLRRGPANLVSNFLEKEKIGEEIGQSFYSFIPFSATGEIFTFVNDKVTEILNKIASEKNFTLTKKEVANGIHPHYDFVNKTISIRHKGKFKVGEGIFGLSNAEKEKLSFNEKELEIIKPYFTTVELDRYRANPKNRLWLIYTNSKFRNPKEIELYPNIKKHLDRFKNVITSDNKPYGLHRAREEKFFKGEKIVVRRKCVGRPSFTYTDFDCYVSATFYIIKTERINLKFLTAILNSKLMAFWLKYKGKMQGNNYQIDKVPLLNMPVKKIDQTNQEKKIQHDKIVELVDQMLKLHKQLAEAKTSYDKTRIQRQINATDRQIDQLVYELYNLTEKEIEIIESSLENKKARQMYS